MTDPYDTADSENLTHDTPVGAIEEFLDDFMSPGCDVAAIIAEHSPIEVTGSAREVVTPGNISGLADSLVADVDTWWTDNFGDPDGDGLNDQQLERDIASAIEAAVKRATVWRCGSVGTREYSEDDVVAMMREQNPGWFEKEGSE